MNMNFPKGARLVVELITGEKLIGQVVEPDRTSPVFFRKLDYGIFLKRESVVSFLANDTIKSIRLANRRDKEIDFKR